ncbi:hypothetical protein NQ317_007808 [Molorchus minor]|uniref:Uncharacterized protein n=1 Tax=Molorchus minor TaxID=1323400 RepID=A0ABQ9ITK5_9CUCU|nr:hypothetical protein NQ317_007808 [Molorchus minor]
MSNVEGQGLNVGTNRGCDMFGVTNVFVDRNIPESKTREIFYQQKHDFTLRYIRNSPTFSHENYNKMINSKLLTLGSATTENCMEPGNL